MSLLIGSKYRNRESPLLFFFLSRPCSPLLTIQTRSAAKLSSRLEQSHSCHIDFAKVPET